MPIGQTLADVLGGLVAINKGDPGGAQAFTKQGRQQLADQRQNQQLDTTALHNALMEATRNPLANQHLQQFLQHGLQNQATVAGTEQTKAVTQGQQLKNTEQQRASEYFQPYGGQAAAEFGQSQAQTAANVEHLGAGTQQLEQQTQQGKYDFGRQQALDRMAIFSGFPNHQAMTEFMNMAYKEKELAAQELAHKQSAGAQVFGHLYPSMSGGVSPAQQAVASQMGINIPTDPAELQKQEMARQAMEAVKSLRAGKDKKKGGGMQDLVQTPQAPAQPPQPATGRSLPQTVSSQATPEMQRSSFQKIPWSVPQGSQTPQANVPLDQLLQSQQQQGFMPQNVNIQQILQMLQQLQGGQ